MGAYSHLGYLVPSWSRRWGSVNQICLDVLQVLFTVQDCELCTMLIIINLISKWSYRDCFSFILVLSQIYIRKCFLWSSPMILIERSLIGRPLTSYHWISAKHIIWVLALKRKHAIYSDVVINGTRVSRVCKTKFIDVYIYDSVLSCRDHFQYNEVKVTGCLEWWIKLGRYFMRKQRKHYIVHFVIHFFYYVDLWGNTYCWYLDPLAKLQNLAIRLITGCRIRAHLFPLYRHLSKI